MVRLTRKSAPAGATILALIGPLSSTACTVSAGPMVTHPTPGGATLGYDFEGLVSLSRGRGVVSRGEGPVLGARASVHRRVDVPDPYFARGALVGGYAAPPLPYRGRVGWEALGSFGFGAYPTGGTSTSALSLGGRVGVPIRLLPAHPPWEADYAAGATPMIVPFLGTEIYWAQGERVDHAARGAIEAGLLLRVHLWSPLLP